jgi:hypothetical protein
MEVRQRKIKNRAVYIFMSISMAGSTGAQDYHDKVFEMGSKFSSKGD